MFQVQIYLKKIINEQYLKGDFLLMKKPILKFRGKYEFEFMLKYINFIIDDTNKTKSILNKKTKLRIDPTIALSPLSQYA